MAAIPTHPVTIAVGGGKGGVGKSMVAANMAIAVANLGFRTILVDADFGTPNQHTLFGIDRPRATLQALLDKSAKSLEEVTEPTGVPRLFLVPGIGAIPGSANLPHQQKLKIIRQIKRLEADVIIVDVGAGISYNVLDLFELGDHRLIVTTPQLPSMQNAYCFLKAAVHRGIKHSLNNHAQKEAFAEINRRSETDRIGDLRRRSYDMGLGLEPIFNRITRHFGGKIVGNMLESEGQKKVFTALSRMAKDFVDLELPVAAILRRSDIVHSSITRRRPFLLSHPHERESRAMMNLAETLMLSDVSSLRARRELVFERPQERPRRPTDRVRFGTTLIEYLREEERVEVNHPVIVASPSGTREGRMADLSPRGLMLEGDLGAEIGQRLKITLPTLPDRPNLIGTVRHVAASGQHYGVQLDPRSEAMAALLLNREQEVPAPLDLPRPVFH